jgi:hypothetical protein
MEEALQMGGMTEQDAIDRKRIRIAMSFRKGDLYMGSLATAGLYRVLGLSYGADGFQEALDAASRSQLDAMLASCKPYLDRMDALTQKTYAQPWKDRVQQNARKNEGREVLRQAFGPQQKIRVVVPLNGPFNDLIIITTTGNYPAVIGTTTIRNAVRDALIEMQKEQLVHLTRYYDEPRIVIEVTLN